MIRYRIEADRSSITAVVRPPMGLPTLPASGQGHVELAGAAAERVQADGPGPIGPDELAGSLRVSLDGQPSADLDLSLAAADSGAELGLGPDGELVLRGQRSSPAEAFGIVGPPLVNPTLLLSWRLVLAPDGPA